MSAPATAATCPRHTFIPFQQVAIADAFWSPRRQVNRTVTVPIAFQRLEEQGAIDGMRRGWKPNPPPQANGLPAHGDQWFQLWKDSDVAKALEAACCTLAEQDDPALRQRVESIIDLLVAAQEADGYLNTWFSNTDPGKRFTNLRDSHELYCIGHLIEAAVAHFQATGNRRFLDLMRRTAEFLDQQFGPGGPLHGAVDGHQEIELALIALADATGEDRWRTLAQVFIDARGQEPNWFDREARARGEDPRAWHRFHEGTKEGYAYMQAERPVRDQQRVGGHAVRAMYQYTAMAALAPRDPTLKAAVQRLWSHLEGNLLYLNGGIGDSAHNEGFTGDRVLPNGPAYCETCAGIGLMRWARAMLGLERDARYGDVLERTLHNNVLTGVTRDGQRFTYANTLAADSANDWHHHVPWYGCCCCPPNVCRTLAALGGFQWSSGDDGLAMHLWIGGTLRREIAGTAIEIEVTTTLPWQGASALVLRGAGAVHFPLHLRIPGWCQGWMLRLNGEPLTAMPQRGYVTIDRTWQPGDRIEVSFDLPVERIHAHPDVVANRGRVAVQRGPLVYCVEECDHGPRLDDLVLAESTPIETHPEPELLGGITALRASAQREIPGNALYQRGRRWQDVPLRLVPLCTWDNRQRGAMQVWLREA